MDKISIVVPVFNVEVHIRKCLDSVIAQTYDNLEILLIDDGSTDSSGEICEEFARRDKRIRLFRLPHKNVSCSRNVGLKSASGRYIGFVDADDWIEPEMYEVLHAEIKKGNATIAVCSYFMETDTESIEIKNKIAIPDEIITTRDLLLYPLKRDYYMAFFGTLWNKLFCAKTIKQSGVCFDESLKYGEDTLFYPSLIIKAKCTGTYIEKPLYHWYQRKTSISKTRSLDIIKYILKAYKKIEELFIQEDYVRDSFWVRGFYCYHASVFAEIAIENGDEKALYVIQDEIRQHLDDYIKTNEEFPQKLDRINKILNTKI